MLNFVVLPADRLVAWWLWWRDAPDSRAAEGHVVWDAIRRRYPEAAAFPAGPVAERAVKRCVRWIVGQGPELTLERVAHAYMTLFLFEATMFALRGSSPRLERDYGFWYHWMPDGSPRTLEAEAELQLRLSRASSHHAAELLAKWAATKPPDSTCPRRADMSRALAEVFDIMPREPRRHKGPQQRPVNVLGMKPQAGSAPLDEPAYDAKLVIARGPGANVDVGSDELMRACGGSLDSLLQDFLEIAATVYVADIYVPRDFLLARDLTFLIPVRHPDVWSAHAEQIAGVVAFLTGNTVELRFTGDGTEADSPPVRYSVSEDERCVALFSGGIDSFAGATHALATGRSPILLSHGQGALLGLQRHLLTALSDGGGDFEAVSVRTAPGGRSVPELDRLGAQREQVLYQYARSFLFLTAATCLSLARGIGTIYMYENGPVSINASFSEARFNTKTTHPVFVRQFTDLVRAVFDVELRIVNPFELMTKGEVLLALDDRWLTQLRHTNSCWSFARVGAWAKDAGVETFAGAHCGRCIPCIWRRAAVRRAGAEAQDGAYLIDSIPESKRDTWIRRDHFTVVADLMRGCQLALALPDDELVDLCPDLDEIGPGGLEERIDMHRRHTAEVVTWLVEANPRFEYVVPAGA